MLIIIHLFLQVSHYAVHASLQMRQESLNKFQNKEKGQYQKNSGFAAMTSRPRSRAWNLT